MSHVGFRSTVDAFASVSWMPHQSAFDHIALDFVTAWLWRQLSPERVCDRRHHRASRTPLQTTQGMFRAKVATPSMGNLARC
ncbi:hypothetical protein PsYK624_169260 [Phanerochaete sordida]|uniref:Uncharacterized protein n=1 Tax=Phanerochaete sordida TaxID=48140 RepID=A0A9P3LMJ6_9APHY|nr:hypothetical protein PsYK624_169260 [Phanerochaete sordida]